MHVKNIITKGALQALGTVSLIVLRNGCTGTWAKFISFRSPFWMGASSLERDDLDEPWDLLGR